MDEDIDIMADAEVAATLREFERVLTAPLADLVSAKGRACADPGRIRRWRLPRADRDALLAFGLPTRDDGQSEVDFRDAVPGGPGFPGRDLYGLLRFRGGGQVVAEAGTGAVRLVPGPVEPPPGHPESWTHNPGVLGILRRHDLGFPLIPVSLVNSSVSLFVDMCWRFERAAEALRKLPTATADPFEVACAHELFDRLDVLVEFVRSVDPPAAEDGAYWPEVIEGW
ncbi:SUKH-4 immunity protein of toxin-antitoxin system [Actinomadura pelletieri DSM 43383]|uniref:SUKH-4 immunity protein of toxin-antitoxin system n=1 Tax=Actinomadura pelletieri DSM 43383 TaxID=1120940 RepID=A0A495QXK8_9ACTN|nr:SUKH-4 family immunity protein [Actinomadura pelletieri]RKS78929.1 SUKH-4 immunity protein of toxin-antitoxin system [Actinomadura pelletieri DSM 43383]